MSFAGRTYKSLVEEVLSYQFQAGKYESLVKTWLNDAQRIAVLETELRKQEKAETFSVPAGTASLALPSGYYEYIDFYNAQTKTQLADLSIEQFDQLQESFGEVRYFAVEGDTLLIYPTPTSTESLIFKYRGLPEDMVADTDEPSIPKRYHQILVGYPMFKAYLRENDYQAAAEWRGIWEADLMKMRGQVNDDLRDGPERVEGQYREPEGILPNVTIPRS